MYYLHDKQKKALERDDYETPEWVWGLFFHYFKNRETRIWAPFYCKGACAPFIEKYHGTKFIHLERDFFSWQPDQWDCIVDNPPYSCKQKVFERCVALEKPFALYVPIDTLERGYIKNLLGSSPHFQIIIPNQRTHFITEYDVLHTCPPHKTAWFCYKMELADGRQLIFQE
jgi:hypothetical protein